MTTSFRIRRRSRAPASAHSQHSSFQAVPLVNVLMNLLARRQRRSVPIADPNWEREEPMSGLS